MSKLNLIQVLNQTLSMSHEIIGRSIEEYSQQQVDDREIGIWLNDSEPLPEWVNRAAAIWIIELWMNERDSCEAEGLLKVDEKYTRLLRDFSMGEIIAMRNQLTQNENLP